MQLLNFKKQYLLYYKEDNDIKIVLSCDKNIRIL